MTPPSLTGAASVITVSTPAAATAPTAILIGSLPGVRSILSREDAREAFGRQDGDTVWDAFGSAPSPVVVAIRSPAPALVPVFDSRDGRERGDVSDVVASCEASRLVTIKDFAVIDEPPGISVGFVVHAQQVKALRDRVDQQRAEAERVAAIREIAVAKGFSDTWVRLAIEGGRAARGTPRRHAPPMKVWISKRDAIALVAAAQGPDVVSRSCARSTLALWVRRGSVSTKDGERPAWAKRPRQLYRHADIARCIATPRRAPARKQAAPSRIGPRAWRLPVGDPRLEPPLRATG